METSRAEAEALAYFQKSGESGESLYSQLTDVLATILITKPANALDAFESISQQVKEGRFTAAAAVAPPAPTEAPVVDSAWEESNLALLKVSRALPLLRPAAAQQHCCWVVVPLLAAV